MCRMLGVEWCICLICYVLRGTSEKMNEECAEVAKAAGRYLQSKTLGGDIVMDEKQVDWQAECCVGYGQTVVACPGTASGWMIVKVSGECFADSLRIFQKRMC